MSHNHGKEQARRLLAKGDHAGAIEALVRLLRRHPDGEVHALLAAAHFLREEYRAAAEQWEMALRFDSANKDWQALRALAEGNAAAEVHVPVPEAWFFERAKLLAPPEVPDGTLPAPLTPDRRAGIFKRLRFMLGTGFGAITAFLLHHVTNLWGKLAGYRDEVWTNWYRRPFLLAILTLAHMRNQLNRRNLKNVYPDGVPVGFQREGQIPPEGVTHFRTADGSWNNLADPKEGAAGTRFPRNVSNDAIRPDTGEALMTPNPREISRKLLSRRGGVKEVPFLNLLAASWIQFMVHDWISHGESLGTEVYAIPLAKDDPARRQFFQSKMFVGKTQPDVTRMPGLDETPATYVNEVTHWWDGSQIYGSDLETQRSLRSGVDGKLRINQDGTLPLDRKGIEAVGFARNWWVGVAMLHTLFVREHNAVCDRLKEAHPDWDDNRLFNVARLINAAVMAKIHTVEWTPAILPNRVLDAALNSNWYGLLTNLFRSGKNRKTLAEINIRDEILGGVVGNPIDKHGAPFGLTEEFVEVYRLHSLMPETLRLRRLQSCRWVEEVPTGATRQAGSAKLTSRFAMADLFYSFGNQNPGQLTLNNYPLFLQQLSIPGNPVFDLGAVDILRARERGVPRYNEFRRQLGLSPIRRFEDLTGNQEHVRALKEVYGKRPEDVEKLDLMIGTLAEGHRPTGFGFGETLFQIFILNATRRLQTDRFYTECYNEEVYTREGLQWIDEADLKAVLLRHYPQLTTTGLANVKNAFEPWDTGERLEPQRHPLRAWDKELGRDPWRIRP